MPFLVRNDHPQGSAFGIEFQTVSTKGQHGLPVGKVWIQFGKREDNLVAIGSFHQNAQRQGVTA